MPLVLGDLFTTRPNETLIDDFASTAKPTHNGIDIGAAQDVLRGHIIKAPEDLVNVSVGYSTSNGNYLIGDSVDRNRKYAFLHMDEPSVSGNRIRGQMVGKVGNTGAVLNGNVHLHLSVITTAAEVDRLGLIKKLPAGAGKFYVSFKELSRKVI